MIDLHKGPFTIQGETFKNKNRIAVATGVHATLMTRVIDDLFRLRIGNLRFSELPIYQQIGIRDDSLSDLIEKHEQKAEHMANLAPFEHKPIPVATSYARSAPLQAAQPTQIPALAQEGSADD